LIEEPGFNVKQGGVLRSADQDLAIVLMDRAVVVDQENAGLGRPHGRLEGPCTAELLDGGSAGTVWSFMRN
jgi:hypothetical protein